ncbi:hypothetical protein EK904_008793 [Melospiza melodia maxima]|nr:hypothetical protein EK904_008793 [Melospiza melodia maxima]
MDPLVRNEGPINHPQTEHAPQKTRSPWRQHEVPNQQNETLKLEEMRQGSQFTVKQQHEPSANSANPDDLDIAHSVLFTASEMPKSQPSSKPTSLH